MLGFWEIPDEDQPPDTIWGDDEALVEWFEDVKRRREAKYKPGADRLEEVPLTDNEIELPKFW